MTYGERIKQGREERGLTQEQLAELLGVSRQAVSKWEMDLSRPARTKLTALSEALGIPPETWAAIDEEAAAAERPRDTARPWKMAACILAAVCLVLGGVLGAMLWREHRIEHGAEAMAAPAPAGGGAGETEAFPELLPLKGRRDFDFGDQPLGEYEAELVSYLNDPAEVLEHALWEDTFPDGLRLALVEAQAHWTEELCHLYLLYARSGEPWQIFFRMAEDLTDPLDSQAKVEPFVNVLGRDGFRFTMFQPTAEYWYAFYITQRSDGTPCMMTNTANIAMEADVDEDGRLEIVCEDPYLPGWEIWATVEGEEGAFIYTLADADVKDMPGIFCFAPEKGGFVVTDSHDAVLARYILRDHGLVRVPLTDFSVQDYPDAAGTRIEFVTNDADGLDPDDVLYNGLVRITHRQQAYLALQELYGLTGIKLDFCYCAVNEYGVIFSLLPDGFNQREFFTAHFTEDCGGNGSIPLFHIAWRELGNDWSPLSLEEAVLPGPETENVLSWYYDRLNLFRTGEAAVETAEGDEEERSLYLENGDRFVGTLRDTDRGPALVSLYGPYPGGIVNH